MVYTCSKGENIYSASKYILKNNLSMRNDSIDEFAGDKIICVPVLTFNKESACHIISEQSKKVIIDYLDKVILNLNEGVLEDPYSQYNKKKKKRKKDESVAMAYREVKVTVDECIPGSFVIAKVESEGEKKYVVCRINKFHPNIRGQLQRDLCQVQYCYKKNWNKIPYPYFRFELVDELVNIEYENNILVKLVEYTLNSVGNFDPTRGIDVLPTFDADDNLTRNTGKSSRNSNYHYFKFNDPEILQQLL